jgi:hypothetical protein
MDEATTHGDSEDLGAAVRVSIDQAVSSLPAYLCSQDQPILPAQDVDNNTSGIEPQGDKNGANGGSDDSADHDVNLI